MTGFVGYDPTLNEVIVSHQGTDVAKMWETAFPACSWSLGACSD